MKTYVHFKVVVEVDVENVDDAWEKAVDELRSGDGDVIGHTIMAEDGSTIEDVCGNYT